MARRRRQSNKGQNEQLILVSVLLALMLASLGAMSSKLLFVFLVCFTIFFVMGIAILIHMSITESDRKKALFELDLLAIDSMPGLEFERWVAIQLNHQGYKVKLTPVNDYGVDIVASKDRIKIAVQVKRYSKVLDQKPVREAVAGMLYYKCGGSMVVTNSVFSESAKVLAKSNRCRLIDREKLASWISQPHSTTAE